MSVILDCDDVLLDWVGGFWDFCEEKTGRTLDRRGPMAWCMASWIGVTPKEGMDYVREFNASEAFGHLKPTVGSVDTVKQLSLANELHVITSCSSAPEIVELREHNLRNVFGDVFASITCLDLGTPKTKELAKHGASFWVEDNVKNAVIGAELGHTAFVRRVTHNRQQEVNKECFGKVTWFTDWSEIEQAIFSKN
jgi:5' nucleotidase, deoxy (Pyrimidine), cytosolic type C protein (NT5C)